MPKTSNQSKEDGKRRMQIPIYWSERRTAYCYRSFLFAQKKIKTNIQESEARNGVSVRPQTDQQLCVGQHLNRAAKAGPKDRTRANPPGYRQGGSHNRTNHPRRTDDRRAVGSQTTSAGTDPAGPLPSVAGDFQLNEGEVLKAEQAAQSDQESEPVQSKTIPAVAAEGAGAVDPEPGSKNGSSSRGEVLPEGIRTQMEPALGADFHHVRLHHDGQAAAVAGQLGVRAFTRGDDIYFGRDQYQPETAAGQHLIGHELAHVRQQKTIPGLQYQLQIPDQRDRYEAEADALADRVVRGTDRNYAKSGNRQSLVQGVPGEIQLAEGEKGSNWILAKVGGLLRNIPGYDLLVLVIGSDPLTGQAVGRDGVTLLKALLGLVPGGNLFVERLEEARVISRAVTWFTQSFQKLNINLTTVKNLFSQAWNGLSALDLLNPGGAFEKLKTIFLSPIRRLTGFIAAAGPKLMEFIFEGAMALAGASAQKIIGLLNQGQGVLQQIIGMR